MTMTADELRVVHKAIRRCEEYESCCYCPYEKACKELADKVNGLPAILNGLAGQNRGEATGEYYCLY